MKMQRALSGFGLYFKPLKSGLGRRERKYENIKMVWRNELMPISFNSFKRNNLIRRVQRSNKFVYRSHLL